MKKLIGVALSVFVLGAVVAQATADHHEGEAKHTIKEVMKQGNHPKTGILSKILKGEGTDADKKKLLDLYISLVENKPEKGEMDSWHRKAGAAATAAAKVVVGREGALDELKKATTCKACHEVHKG